MNLSEHQISIFESFVELCNNNQKSMDECLKAAQKEFLIDSQEYKDIQAVIDYVNS